MEINTRNEINGQMCYVCKTTFVQFRKIRYYYDLCGKLIQAKPRVICAVCKNKKMLDDTKLNYQWLAFKWQHLE